MATFSDTILQAIFDYRQLLKRHLKVKERRAKLQALSLDSSINPTDEPLLYELGHRILADLKATMMVQTSSYYSYSGVQKFAEHLQAILDQHELREDTVIHKGQQASRALLHAIQVLMSASTKLSESVRHNLVTHSQVIANHGSHEQRQSFCAAIKKFLNTDELFVEQLLQDFE
ncbi:MAG TPA: hypothetical protein VD770_02735 [Coxiellaceae bacterium]|nr:hypothetical protein [Coxiellaceae bacterium]